MQDVQQLSPLEVGLRQLPQAVTGLVFSPIVGCWMHKIDNMFFIVAAALCHVCAGTLLLFLQSDSNYFAFIFPSMILSTLSMDWVRNVGAVSRLPSIQPLPFPDRPSSFWNHTCGNHPGEYSLRHRLDGGWDFRNLPVEDVSALSSASPFTCEIDIGRAYVPYSSTLYSSYHSMSRW